MESSLSPFPSRYKDEEMLPLRRENAWRGAGSPSVAAQPTHQLSLVPIPGPLGGSGPRTVCPCDQVTPCGVSTSKVVERKLRPSRRRGGWLQSLYIRHADGRPDWLLSGRGITERNGQSTAAPAGSGKAQSCSLRMGTPVLSHWDPERGWLGAVFVIITPRRKEDYDHWRMEGKEICDSGFRSGSTCACGLISTWPLHQAFGGRARSIHLRVFPRNAAVPRTGRSANPQELSFCVVVCTSCATCRGASGRPPTAGRSSRSCSIWEPACCGSRWLCPGFGKLPMETDSDLCAS